jgi:hypothetical protein
MLDMVFCCVDEDSAHAFINKFLPKGCIWSIVYDQGQVTVILKKVGPIDAEQINKWYLFYPNVRLCSWGPSESDKEMKKTPLDKAIDFLDEVKETLKSKNKAYGNSASNPVRIFSKCDADEGIKVRIDDKLSRIARGDGSGNEDAIKDLVGYLALLRGMQKDA